MLRLTLLAALLAPLLTYANSCMLQSESTSGFYKTCTYQCLGGLKSITIKSTELCPLTIK